MPARILVVDDSPTILKVVGAILARNGYEVETARDGVFGLQKVTEHGPFDLVLLDFVMPRMNGYQFCREVRQNPSLKPAPVVLMSAKGDRIRDQFVQQTGAVDAITKPFDPRGLVAVVEGALAKVKAGRAPIVPEGETMPEESSIGTDDESRPSLLPIKLERKAASELSKHMVSVLAKPLAELGDDERKNPEALARTITRAVTQSALDPVLTVMREALSGVTREVLSGDLSLVPLAEVLQLLNMQRQTGVMRISSGSRSLTIAMREGLIDFARGPDKSEFRLGRYFVEIGALTRPAVESVAESAKRDGKRLGDALVAMGKITDEQRRDALVRQTSELVYDLVRWPYGRFWFARDPLPPEADDAKLGLGVAGLVLEGFRRVDEWRLMEGTIVWDQVVVVDEAAHKQVTGQLTRAEHMVLEAADGKRTINQIVAETDLGRFDALKIVYQFLSSRVLRPLV